MARLELNPDLEAIVAARVAQAVDRAAGTLAQEVQRRVPAAKVWVSRSDGQVRPSHIDAHGQTVPYKVKRMIYVRKGRRRPGQRGINVAGGWRKLETFELVMQPGDMKLTIENRINCRCTSRIVPGLTARAVQTSAARVEGARVRARVTVRFNRIVESEFAEQGGGWARAALRATGARYSGKR